MICESEDSSRRFEEIDPAAVAAAIELHRAEPGITPDQHIRRRMIGLGREIAGKRKIYLDTRYWIYMRDAAMNRAQKPVHDSLLQELRQAVAKRIALCPMSDVILVELLKQSDATTRLTTARLIDELGHGVSLVAEDQRAGTEFAHFLYDLGARADVHPLEHLVWTKSCFAWGEIYPLGMQIDAATKCALQKAFIDHQWQLPLEGMVHILGTPLPDGIVNFDDTARRLNAANRAHSDEVRTFQKAVVNELAGVLDLYQERLADICIEMYERQEGRRPELLATERRGTESQMRTAFINLFRLRPEVMAKRAPTLYVHAKCHAAIRWDKKRNLTGNDLIDFHHAAGALGYCDAFFADNPLKVLLSQHHVGLPSELGRFVTADDREAVEYVRGLS